MAYDRDQRQHQVFDWVTTAFGPDHANSLPARATRFFEEAIELYQAAGGDLEMAHRLLDFVFSRPVGELNKEIGAVGLTLLSVAALLGLSATEEEEREVDRVTAIDPAKFRERNREKNDAGFNAEAYPVFTATYYPGDPRRIMQIRRKLGMGEPDLGSPCLCGLRREEDCKPENCEAGP